MLPGLALRRPERQIVIMSVQEIEAAIPHRPPMRLIDEIISRDDSTIVCRKSFEADEFFVQGHFPDSPIVPGSNLYVGLPLTNCIPPTANLSSDVANCFNAM